MATREREKMFISKIRRKINTSVCGVKKNVTSIFKKDPKRKFFFGKYYKSCSLKKNRVLVNAQELEENTIELVKGLFAETKGMDYELYLAIERTNASAVKELFEKNELSKIKFVARSSYQYLKILATAEYLLSTQVLPTYFVKKNTQNYLYLWQNEEERVQSFDSYMKNDTGEVQHSLLQSSYLCFCGLENKQEIIDAFCLSSLYTGQIFSTDKDLKASITNVWGLLLKKQVEKFIIEDFSANKNKVKRVIIPKIVNSEKDFETLKRFVKQDDIVQFSKKQFNKNVRNLLSNEYKNVFDFIVIDPVFPRSYGEEIKLKLGNVATKEQVDIRNKTRKYADLVIAEDFIKKIAVLEVGCSINNAKIENIEAEISIKKQSCLEINIAQQEKYEIKQVLLADKKNDIICMRKTTEEEQRNGQITEDFNAWNELLAIKGRYQILADIWDKEEQKSILAAFSSSKIAAAKQENNEPLARVASYLEPMYHEKNAYLCYQNGKEQLMLVICAPERVLHEQIQARLLKMKSGKSTLKISAKLKKVEGMKITDVILRYRSIMSYDIPVSYKVKEQKSHYIITADIDFSKIPLRELYWDLHILVEKQGRVNELFVKFPNQYWKCKFYLTNKDYKAGEGHIIFPYYTVANCLAFLYRASSPYDGYSTKLKDIIASGVYIFAKPFLQKKRIWLVFEKFCTMAQDNGYYFFRYCMENLPEAEKKHIYYVIDKKAPDYDKVKPYEKQVIQFMSLKHCLYMLGAKLYVGSDARSHLYAWRSKTSLIRSKMITRPIFFLQHGVTALKDVAKIFGANGSSAMTYFTTTSKFEQEIAVNKLHYKRENAPITGFTRWDVLEDTSKKDEKLILMMPTWRSWLEEVTDEDFQQSDYYKNYSNLLQDHKLLDILEKYNVKMVFYIHPKFASYQKNFTSVGERIILVPFGSEPLNEIIKKCHMLITDYSSVCWDVYYQKKPVVFYQFDYDKYNVAHGSFIDMETELFGRRATKEAVLLQYVEECIASDFKLLEEDEKKHSYYFEYMDDNNSQRAYEYLREKGY